MSPGVESGDAAERSQGDDDVRPSGTSVGAYRILKLLASGGMGHVYLAEHTCLGRKVALKMMRAEYAASPSTVRRFFNEARAMSQIHQENLVEVTDFGESDNEKYYIMELIEGPSLAEVIEEGPVPPLRATKIGAQICDALTAAHAAGIVHRDLKPANVFLLDRGGREFVKLTDFGVAKLTNPQTGDSVQNTASYTILGTPEYMAPEQIGGLPIDHRVDIYAFGVVLFEMITGRRPFAAKSFGEYLIKHNTVDPPSPRSLMRSPEAIPQVLEELILFCLAKRPQDRPQSIGDVAEMLRDVGEALPADPRPRRRWGLRLRLLVPVAIGAVLLAVASLIASRTGTTSYVPPAPVPIADTMPRSPDPEPEVLLSFVSNPPGAEVFRQGSDKPLGSTPFAAAFERSSSGSRFEFRLKRHRPQQVEVSLTADAEVRVEFERLRRRKALPEQLPEASRTGKGRLLDRNGVMGVFE